MTNKWGLLSAPSTRFPGELTLACTCGSIDLTLTCQYPVRGSGPCGRGRLGDYGTRELVICNTCGAKHYEKG